MCTRKQLVVKVVAAFMAAALAFSGVQLWRYFAAEKEAEETYSALVDLIHVPPEKGSEKPPTTPGWTVQEQYGKLFAQNSDMIGWVSIEGTQLNYPVMYTPNAPDYYLRRGFDKKYSDYGVPYAAEGGSISPPSDNITIYGHNMRSGKLFAALEGYKREDFWREHPVIKFDTRAGFGEYAVLAVFRTTPAEFAYHKFVNATSEAEFNAYVQRCKGLAFYDTCVSAQYGDRLITLSTCEYSQRDGRLVMVAKKVS